MALSDRRYLRENQYRDASNLTARGGLHERFSTNGYGWHRWVFDRLELPADGWVLELGCGPGWLWRENSSRVPATWTVMLSDFSQGMVREAERNLAAVGLGQRARLSFAVADAGAIPFGAASFDAVVANHMLYHLPDLAGALSEVRRVLRPGGRFYAATNGRAHLQELDELLARFDPAITRAYTGGATPAASPWSVAARTSRPGSRRSRSSGTRMRWSSPRRRRWWTTSCRRRSCRPGGGRSSRRSSSASWTARAPSASARTPASSRRAATGAPDPLCP